LIYARKALGVEIDVLSLQNEPGVPAPWASCVWTGAELRDFLKIVAPVVREKGLNTKFMLSEGTAWSGAWEHLKPTLQDPDARRFLNIMASHSYGPPEDKGRAEFAAASGRNGLPVWMSEMSLMIPPQPDDPGMNAALRIASFIHRDLVDAHASAWIYCFAIFIPNFQGSMGVLSPVDKQAALVVPKRCWTLANYSRFVRPGWKLMRVDGGDTANTGFVSPEGDRFAIVTLNARAAPQPAAYHFGDWAIGQVEAFATTAGLDLARIPSPAIEPHQFHATLLPMSVTTFVGTIGH
jgi:O-glycosyl hydrolase